MPTSFAKNMALVLLYWLLSHRFSLLTFLLRFLIDLHHPYFLHLLSHLVFPIACLPFSWSLKASNSDNQHDHASYYQKDLHLLLELVPDWTNHFGICLLASIFFPLAWSVRVVWINRKQAADVLPFLIEEKWIGFVIPSSFCVFQYSFIILSPLFRVRQSGISFIEQSEVLSCSWVRVDIWMSLLGQCVISLFNLLFCGINGQVEQSIVVQIDLCSRKESSDWGL